MSNELPVPPNAPEWLDRLWPMGLYGDGDGDGDGSKVLRALHKADDHRNIEAYKSLAYLRAAVFAQLWRDISDFEDIASRGIISSDDYPALLKALSASKKQKTAHDNAEICAAAMRELLGMKETGRP